MAGTNGYTPWSFGYQRDPSTPRGHSNELFNNIFYSAGIPGLSSLYADQFMRNLQQGRPGYTGFPDWFNAPENGGGGSGGGSTPPGSGGGAQNFGNIPRWWQDWYNASGKHGGVPPVQGLL